MRAILVLCVIASSLRAAPQAPPATVAVHGHRGARAMRPENTLPAFQYALETGVDVLELDVAVTKDDVLVVSHDPHVNPEICEATDGTKYDEPPPIHEFTLAELQKKFDCGGKKHPRFPKQEPVKGTPIPTLEAVFELVKTSPAPAAATVELNIETKIVPRDVGKLMPNPARFARLLVDLVKKSRMEKRVIVQSFDHRSLVETRKLAPKIRIAALLAEDFPDWESIIFKLKPNYLSPNVNWITADAVKKAHAHHVQVVPWTLDSEDDWTYALSCGVDGIISDDPASLLAFLRARGKHR